MGGGRRRRVPRRPHPEPHDPRGGLGPPPEYKENSRRFLLAEQQKPLPSPFDELTTITLADRIQSRTTPEEEAARAQHDEYQENSRRFFLARAALRGHRFEEAQELLLGMAGLDFGLAAQHWAPSGNFHSAEFHADLGTTLASAGRFREAVPCSPRGCRAPPAAPRRRRSA